MSSFQNPWTQPEIPSIPEPLPPSPPVSENPVWSGWDVLQIALLTIASIVVLLLLSAFAAQRLLYPHAAFVEVVQFPLVTVVAQGLAYLVVLGFMVAVVKRVPGREFWRELRWRWPKNWPVYLFAGLALSVGLQAFAHLLPMPKELPMDRFFRTAQEAWVLSLFGTAFAPLMEELFFRGFLYPVLVRRLGIVSAVILTSASFGLIHAPQLGHAWGPVLVIFLVGLTLTITRAVTKSVASGFLIHVAYNTTLSVALYVGTDGFR
ncbi:MAG: type II CAAX endopeptidase family protein, partial [Terriglobales bacterium]